MPRSLLFLVVDLEATCSRDRSVPKDEMETIEIGAVLIDAQNLKPVSSRPTFSRLVRPVRNPTLTPFCSELTGIQQKGIDSAISFPEAFKRFCSWWRRPSSEVVFMSWGSFDRNQLQRDCEFHGVEYPFSTHWDLSKMFTKKTGRRAGHRKAMKILGIEPQGQHHRGLDDALNTSKMLPFFFGEGGECG